MALASRMPPSAPNGIELYMILECPPQLPESLRSAVLQFASTWAASELRPRVAPEVTAAWDALVRAWIRETSLPLYIRKSAAKRGAVVQHSSGRALIPCDNSTAVWAFTLGLEGHCPSLDEIASLVNENAIPVEFTRLGRFSAFYSAGWKLAHIDGVGLHTRMPVEEIPIDTLEEHFAKLVSPANHFAVPKVWAGLGEIPEVVEVLRTYEALSRGERAPRTWSVPVTVAAAVVEEQSDGEDRPSTALGAHRYRATRLLFKASVIDRLTDDQAFCVETPEGTYEITKRQFLTTFANVAASETYRRTGVYSYSATPAKARRFLVRAGAAG